MPLYTYRCRACGEEFDLLVGVTARKTEMKCSKCGSPRIERVFAAFRVGGSGSTGTGSDAACPTGRCPLG